VMYLATKAKRKLMAANSNWVVLGRWDRHFHRLWRRIRPIALSDALASGVPLQIRAFL